MPRTPRFLFAIVFARTTRGRENPESAWPQKAQGPSRKRRAPETKGAESAGPLKARGPRKRGAFKKHGPRILNPCLSDELLQLSGFLNTEFAEKPLDATASPATLAASPVPAFFLTCPADYVILNVDSPELRIYRLLVVNNLETVFPNIVIALRIYRNVKQVHVTQKLTRCMGKWYVLIYLGTSVMTNRVQADFE